MRRVVSSVSHSPTITTTTHRIEPNLRGKRCRPHHFESHFGSTGLQHGNDPEARFSHAGKHGYIQMPLTAGKPAANSSLKRHLL